MDWRVIVVDQKRFCIVGTMDLTFAECSRLSNDTVIRLPERMLETIGSFEVKPEATYSVFEVRGQHFRKRDSKGNDFAMLHVIIDDSRELDGLRRTGRFREWDADLRQAKS